MFFSKLFDKIQGLLLIVAGISFVFNIVTALFEVENVTLYILSFLWLPCIWAAVNIGHIQDLRKPAEESIDISFDRTVRISLILSIAGFFSLIFYSYLNDMGTKTTKIIGLILAIILPVTSHFLSIYCGILTERGSKSGNENKVSFGFSTVSFALVINVIFERVLINSSIMSVKDAYKIIVPLMIISLVISLIIYIRRLAKR